MLENSHYKNNDTLNPSLGSHYTHLIILFSQSPTPIITLNLCILSVVSINQNPGPMLLSDIGTKPIITQGLCVPSVISSKHYTGPVGSLPSAASRSLLLRDSLVDFLEDAEDGWTGGAASGKPKPSAGAQAPPMRLTFTWWGCSKHQEAHQPEIFQSPLHLQMSARPRGGPRLSD